MLEKMDEFFENRLSDYDEHMLTTIEGADEFYKFTAALLPLEAETEILDLGCGTGLELEEYFALNPHAHVTGIDLSKAMLERLKANFVLTDYFAESEALEKEYFETFEKLKQEQGISDHEFYHYDIPLTVEHEIAILKGAGFSDVRILKNWGATYTLLAKR